MVTGYEVDTGNDIEWPLLNDTAVVTGVGVGVANITATAEGKSATVSITVLAPPQNICTLIAGASVVANDGTYLGRLTNRFDSQSIYNEFGTYGSQYSSLSIYNPYGTYGSKYSSKSPWNPYTSTPPVLVKNGSAIAYFTVNTFKTPRVSPSYAETCSFP